MGVVLCKPNDRWENFMCLEQRVLAYGMLHTLILTLTKEHYLPQTVTLGLYLVILISDTGTSLSTALSMCVYRYTL